MDIALIIVIVGLVLAYLGYRDVRHSRIKVGGRYDKHVEMMSGPRYVLVTIQILTGVVMAVIGALDYFEVTIITEDNLRLVLIIGLLIFAVTFVAGLALTAGREHR
jgi:hypothetical protein